MAERFEVHLGDCLQVLRGMPDNSVDAVVTDPPYGLGKEPDAMAMLKDWITSGHHEVKGAGFMGKAWDAFVPQPVLWAEVYRVLKPGGHVVAFAGTRTQDLMALGLRLAGFEIRDLLAWVYGSGFPKSLDVSKAIDKAAGAVRDVVGQVKLTGTARKSVSHKGHGAGAVNSADPRQYRETFKEITAPATDAARAWQGWGTALKPALEPITLARKPLDGTVAANVLKWRTGAVNVDGCRVVRVADDVSGWSKSGSKSSENRSMSGRNYARGPKNDDESGRWPANLIHDGSEEVLAGFPESKGQQGFVGARHGDRASVNTYGDYGPLPDTPPRGDTGSAARFFYCAKASKRDRDEGLEGFEEQRTGAMAGNLADGSRLSGSGEPISTHTRANIHPTVKPTDLMRWLCRLITPPGGLILDPFTGSGSTGKAAVREGFRFVGCELDPQYREIAVARIAAALADAEPEPEPAADNDNTVAADLLAWGCIK